MFVAKANVHVGAVVESNATAALDEENLSLEPHETTPAEVEVTTPIQLPPTHVPPLNAPTQMNMIAPASSLATGKFRQYVYSLAYALALKHSP